MLKILMRKLKESKKTSLFLSLLCIMLSFSLLIGNTYAWFTDSAVSSSNRIKSGSLNVGLEFRKVDLSSNNSSSWADVQGSSEIIDNTGSYKPGYVSLTLFRVKNLGNLALKYQLALIKKAETEGTNIDGEKFYLSDNLSFNFIVLDETTAIKKSDALAENLDPSAFSGQKALALVGENSSHLGYNIQNMVDAIMPVSENTSEQDKYHVIALVIYMPSTVGSRTMYDPSFAAPSISLDIKLVATQASVEAEKDSFDQYYDSKAFYSDEEDTDIPRWSAFQYIKGDLANELNCYDSTGRAVVSVKTQGTKSATLVVSECNVPIGFNVASNTTYKSYSIHLLDDNGKSLVYDNSTSFDVKMYVGTGLPNCTLYHNGTSADFDSSISDVLYNAETGYISFKTKSFSTFTASTAAISAKIGNTYYADLNAAVSAINDGQVENGSTIQLTAKKNVINSKLRLFKNKSAVLDLNGCNLYANIDTAIDNEGTMTIKDSAYNGLGTEALRGSIEMDMTVSKGITFISNTGTMNIECAKISAAINYDSDNSRFFGISNNSGTLNLIDSEIIVKCTKKSSTDTGAVYGIYNSGNQNAAKLLMKNTSVNVQAKNGSAYGVNNWLTTDVNITDSSVNVDCTGSQCYGIKVASKTNDNSHECKNFVLNNVNVKARNSVPAEINIPNKSNFVRGIDSCDIIQAVSIKNTNIEVTGKDCPACAINDASKGMSSYEINSDKDKNIFKVTSNKTANGLELSDDSESTVELNKQLKNTKFIVKVENGIGSSAARIITIRNKSPIALTVSSCDMYAESNIYSANGIWNYNQIAVSLSSGNRIELVAPNGSTQVSYNVPLNSGSYSKNSSTHKIWSN